MTYSIDEYGLVRTDSGQYPHAKVDGAFSVIVSFPTRDVIMFRLYEATRWPMGQMAPDDPTLPPDRIHQFAVTNPEAAERLGHALLRAAAELRGDRRARQ